MPRLPTPPRAARAADRLVADEGAAAHRQCRAANGEDAAAAAHEGECGSGHAPRAPTALLPMKAEPLMVALPKTTTPPPRP